MKKILILIVFLISLILLLMVLTKSCNNNQSSSDSSTEQEGSSEGDKKDTKKKKEEQSKGDKDGSKKGTKPEGSKTSNSKNGGSKNYNTNESGKNISKKSPNKWKSELSQLNYKQIEDSLKVILQTKLVSGFKIKKIAYDKYDIINGESSSNLMIQTIGTIEIENQENIRYSLKFTSVLERLSNDIFVLAKPLKFEKIE